MKYGFTLILSKPDVTDEETDALYESGCDDSSVLIRDGAALIQFDRDAPTLEQAIMSAIQDVEGAGLQVARVGN